MVLVKNADEAREIMKNVRNNKSKNDIIEEVIDYFLGTITHISNLGHNTLRDFVTSELMDAVSMRLRNLGFAVTHENRGHELYLLTIKW